MSFTADTKKELTTLEPGKKCCQLAVLAGFLRFAGSIKLMGGRMAVKVTTDSPAVARFFLTLSRDYFGSKAALTVADPKPLSKGRLYELLVTPDMNAEGILRECGMVGVREGSNFITDGLPQELIKKRCCRKAMLKGIFLASGSLSDPAKSYHLDISCSSMPKAEDTAKLMTSLGLRPGITLRRGKPVVYIKDGEQIEDFLGICGVSGQLFRFQDVRIKREMRNMANRLTNCDSANLEKTVGAAQRQLSDIAVLEAAGKYESLPQRLRETAELRKAHPELPLSELCLLFNPPLKKSGLDHRFRKLAEIAEEVKMAVKQDVL